MKPPTMDPDYQVAFKNWIRVEYRQGQVWQIQKYPSKKCRNEH